MKRILFAILFLLFACNAWAATYYVKTGGNDSAAGTSDGAAWAHCPGMTGWTGSVELADGDTVYFDNQSTFTGAAPLLTITSPGVTYNGTDYGAGSGTRAILQASSSSSTAYSVIYVGYSNINLVGLDVDAYDLGIGGIALGGYADHDNDISGITIDNCNIHDVGNCGGGVCSNSTTTWLSGIDMSPRNGAGTEPHSVSNVIIKNTTIHDVVRDGIAVYPTWGEYNGNYNDTVLIQNCNIYNAGKNGDYGWPASGVGVHVKDDSRNVTVEFCNLHDNGHAGILYEAYYEDPLVAPTKSIARYNLIYDNGVYGVFYQHSADNTASFSADFYGNLVWNNGRSAYSTSAAQLIFSAADFRASTINIYNNTFQTDTSVVNVSYPRTVVLGTGQTDNSGVSGSPTINFKNNVVYQDACASSTKTMVIDVGQKLTHGNNMYYCGTGEAGYKVCSGVSTFYKTNAQVQGWEATAQVTDPSFTGGDLPTGFTGTYGTDLRPNTTYFSITSGDALGNGTVLASPYNKAINYAGTSSTYNRGAAWDIGAYEYTYDGGAIVNTGAVFSGCTF